MLKSQIVKQAFGQLEISGVTRKPTPDDNEIAGSELEQMMYLWLGNGLDIGYRFTEEEQVDLNEESGVAFWSVTGIVASLAKRLADYFGMPVHPSTEKKSLSGLSVIRKNVYTPKDVSYPGRMPRGQGNQRFGYRRSSFYPKQKNPLTDNIKQMAVSEIRDYCISIATELAPLEEIESVCLEACPGLNLVYAEENANKTEVKYRVEATQAGSNLRVTFSFETTCGNVYCKEQYFSVIDKSIDNCC